MSAIVCFNVTARTPVPPTQPIDIKYNVSIVERRFNPRAVLDNPSQVQPQNLSLLPGDEFCQHIYFHVMETTDYSRPIVFAVQVGLQNPEQTPVLDDAWPTVTRTELPFWNGCDEDNCIPDLSLQSMADLMTPKQFCAQPVQSQGVFCGHMGEAGTEGSLRVMDARRGRMVVDVRLENRGENAYGARINISHTTNLHLTSLHVKDNSDIRIVCSGEDKLRPERICNVSTPFMRAKSKVYFRLEFVFSRSVVLDHLRILLEASSDGEDVSTADNFNDIYYFLQYEADLLFTRSSNPTRYEIKSELSLEDSGVIGPPFNFTFQIQNLGYFPVRDLQLNIEIPEMTRNGNQLLQIHDFSIDQKDGTYCLPPQHVAQSRAAPEDLSRYTRLNRSNTLTVPMQCSVNVASYSDIAVRITGALRVDTLHALRFKIVEVVSSATVELPTSSVMFLHEEQPVRHIVLEIRKAGDYRIPTWIIVGSTLGGLLLLALLSLALWKLGFFRRQKRREEDVPNGKVSEER